MAQLTKLFTPGRIGTLEVKNRLMMAAMGTFSADEKGHPTERLVDYYKARAEGGVGLIMPEATCVDCPLGGGSTTLRGRVDKFIAGLS